MVTALQTMVTRGSTCSTRWWSPSACFHAGTRRNIIPDEATVRGDRAHVLRRSARAQVRRAGRARSARASPPRTGCDVEVALRRGVPGRPSTTPPSTTFARRDRARGVRRGAVTRRWRNPMTGSEDFSRVLERVPGRVSVPRRLHHRRPGDRADEPLAARRVRRQRARRRRRPARRARGAPACGAAGRFWPIVLIGGWSRSPSGCGRRGRRCPGSRGSRSRALGLRRRVEPSIVIVPVRSLLTKKTAPPPSLALVVLDDRAGDP